MNISIGFSAEEMAAFLQKRGYAVYLKKVRMSYPAYHDDMEYEDEDVWAVSKDGVEIKKPGGYSFKKEEWLGSVFSEELHKALLAI